MFQCGRNFWVGVTAVSGGFILFDIATASQNDSLKLSLRSESSYMDWR